MCIEDFANIIETNDKDLIRKVILAITKDSSFTNKVLTKCIYPKANMTRRRVINTMSDEGYLYKVKEFKNYKITLLI